MLKYTAIGIVLTIAGCSAFSSPRTTLGTLQDAAIASRMTMRPVIDGACAEELRRCEQANKLIPAMLISVGDCPGFDMCNKIRMIIINTLEAVQFAIADANLALAMGQEDRFEDAVMRVEELLSQIQIQMQILGIIPEVDDGEEI